MCAPTNVYVFKKFKRNQSFKGNETLDANNNPPHTHTQQKNKHQKIPLGRKDIAKLS